MIKVMEESKYKEITYEQAQELTNKNKPVYHRDHSNIKFRLFDSSKFSSYGADGITRQPYFINLKKNHHE